MKKLSCFIGYDSKEDIAYRVCKYSLLKRSTIEVNIFSLKLDELIAKKYYNRTIDPLASTQFTYSRFLVPALMNFQGWAIFCDCDFIFLDDISKLLQNLDERWNWLEGWTSNHNQNNPFAVHYTRGGPWFDEWQDVEFAKEWLNERDEYLSKKFEIK